MLVTNATQAFLHTKLRNMYCKHLKSVILREFHDPIQLLSESLSQNVKHFLHNDILCFIQLYRNVAIITFRVVTGNEMNRNRLQHVWLTFSFVTALLDLFLNVEFAS